MMTFFSAAYIAEVIRGGIQAIPKGQYEAADAIGLTYWQTTRFITLPQALKISIPGIVNTFIGLSLSLKNKPSLPELVTPTRTLESVDKPNVLETNMFRHKDYGAVV